MDKNYYIPSIEDIRVGYECEIAVGSDGKEIPWYKITIKEENTIPIQNVIKSLKYGMVRTPYLTKEQVEVEGWVRGNYVNISGFPARYGFEKDNYFLVLDLGFKIPSIEFIFKDPSLEENYKNPEFFKIMIPCPSINEFRTICKLLTIK